ncbi:glycosyltransferase family 4 protein [Carboxylicivirga sp. RSCT41]|uniref:glycosyltransferase family 4 protein n=1 Tax=Carboxylicivirga agarovorans TaxID=3417570 RepID=UPI003D33371A
MSKKLLYITNQVCGAGGLERVLSIKATYFAESMDYKVHILTLNQKGIDNFYNFSSKIEFHDVRVRGNAFSYFLKYRNGILSTINKVNPDVICVCDDGLKGLFVPLLYNRKIPVVYERHTVKRAFHSKKLSSKLWNKILDKVADYGSRLYDQFVVLTIQNSQEWPKAKVKVIPNPNPFNPKTKSSLKNKKVISVGTMSHVKGFDLLLEAWKLVVDQHPDWHLEIYGKPVLKEELEQYAESLRIENNVNFYGPVKNIEEKYTDASIYTLSSRYEGFGMVLIEAMACGVPCVSFNCPHGPGDIIRNNEDGFLITNGHVEEFASAIINLIKDEDLRLEMGRNAVINAQRYSIDEIGREWVSLFNQIKN